MPKLANLSTPKLPKWRFEHTCCLLILLHTLHTPSTLSLAPTHRYGSSVCCVLRRTVTFFQFWTLTVTNSSMQLLCTCESGEGKSERRGGRRRKRRGWGRSWAGTYEPPHEECLTGVFVLCRITLNSLTTIGYLLGVFFRLWIPFWSVFPLLLGDSTENLS